MHLGIDRMRGCDGLFVISSTGGMPFLDDEDRQRIVDTARQACPIRQDALCRSISGMGVKQTLRYARQAGSWKAPTPLWSWPPFFA